MPLSDQRYPESVIERVQKLKAILFDVDGVLTDGGIIIHSDGSESKRFNVQDGLGIYLAKKAGLIIGIITGRESEATKIRAEELNVDFLSQGKKDKSKPYEEFKKEFNLKDEEIGFVGDDLIDLPAMLRCGFIVSVANGREEVKEKSHYITKSRGGHGAAREVIEFVLEHQGKWQDILNNYYGTGKG